jgi:serine protease Do
MTPRHAPRNAALALSLTLAAGLIAAPSVVDALQPDDDALRLAPEHDAEFRSEQPEDVQFARALSDAFERASDIIAPSVVNITTRTAMRDFRSGRTALVDSGVGSGVIVSESGYVLTNNHVIADAANATVRLQDGREFEADLIGRDALRDLALLRIDADGLTPAVFADSDDVRVGQWVLAVGSPFGFSSTVTAGIVSAKGRGLGISSRASAAFEDFIQTDAAINKGNSGGPLIDLDGHVVGINSAIFSPSGGSVGIGFSIPSHIVQAVYDRLREGGTVGRGWIGVDLANVDPSGARRAGLENAAGAIVARVIEGGPADQSGLEPGDIVTSFNGRPVTDYSAFVAAIGIAAPGTVAKLQVVRDGDTVPVDLHIGDFDALAVLAASQIDDQGRVVSEDSAAAAVLNLYGLTLAAPSDSDLEALRRRGVEGVWIDRTARGAATASARLQAGDLITHVNGQPVSTPADVVAALVQGNAEGSGVPVRIYRQSENLVGETVIRP